VNPQEIKNLFDISTFPIHHHYAQELVQSDSPFPLMLATLNTKDEK